MNRSILIVEDDADFLELLKFWFIRAGYRVTGVLHPRQALAAASLRQYQVALLDASLPEIDGFQLAQRLQRMQEDIQVVMLSGYEFAPSPDVFACLIKPCPLEQVERTVEQAFETMHDVALEEDAQALLEAN